MENHLFFTITNCQIVRPCSLPHRINYKFMCCPGNERARICAVIPLGAPQKETLSYSSSFPAGRRLWKRIWFLLALRTYACTFKSNLYLTSSQGSNSPYIWPSKQLTGVVFNHLSVVKPKLKFALSPIAKDKDNPMKSINQSKLVVNTCSWHKARENVSARVAIGFGLTYD